VTLGKCTRARASRLMSVPSPCSAIAGPVPQLRLSCCGETLRRSALKRWRDNTTGCINVKHIGTLNVAEKNE
jgi:hypothetical protein